MVLEARQVRSRTAGGNTAKDAVYRKEMVKVSSAFPKVSVRVKIVEIKKGTGSRYDLKVAPADRLTSFVLVGTITDATVPRTLASSLNPDDIVTITGTPRINMVGSGVVTVGTLPGVRTSIGFNDAKFTK